MVVKILFILGICLCCLEGYGQPPHVQRKVCRLVDADSVRLADISTSHFGGQESSMMPAGFAVRTRGEWIVCVMTNGWGPRVEYQIIWDSTASGRAVSVSWMIGIARVMAAMKNNWRGTLVLAGVPGGKTAVDQATIPSCVKARCCALLSAFNHQSFATRAAGNAVTLAGVMVVKPPVGRSWLGW